VNVRPALAARVRLAELASVYALPPAAVDRLAILLELMADDASAPSSVRDPADAVDVHVADSLTGLEIAALRTAERIADLGAGAGFPGLVLAAARPGAAVALVESVGRRCAWLDRAIAATGMDNARVVCARAEAWSDGLGTCDAVTARALAALPVLVEYAAPLLRVGGELVAWKGHRSADDEACAARTAAVLGLEPAGVLPVRPFPHARARHLHRFRKMAETPPGYPRRPGAAAKRPLRPSDRPRR
jgi:16S rRNA (guanine527-N7)-methyltransferase